MSIYKNLLFPVLRRFDPESTHNQTLRALAFAQNRRVGQAVLRRIAGQVPERPVELFGLRFPNELGVAAGFDKNAQVITGLYCLGFGHVEVGTLTPAPQVGNPRPRIFRLPEDEALINRMGFPNQGVKDAARRIKQRAGERGGLILGVSLGKQKETELEAAAEDYLAVMERVYPYADYLVINVSSPNTPGLRMLQSDNYLDQLVKAVAEHSATLAKRQLSNRRPLLLKISPDLSWPELDSVLEVAEANVISGVVACNTTISRDGLSGNRRVEPGGLSGRPLRSRSSEIIRYVWNKCGGRMPIIGVGGILSADDVREKIDAGASLVQLYTGLVYGGPGIAGQILRRLQEN